MTPWSVSTSPTIESGTVMEINEALVADPSVVNTDPVGEGWFIHLRVSDPSELEGLLGEEAYESFIAAL